MKNEKKEEICFCVSILEKNKRVERKCKYVSNDTICIDKMAIMS